MLVLDYLCHACYPSTVKRLLEDSAVQQQVDADGDEIIPSEPFLTPKGGYAFEDDGGVSPELLMQVELRESEYSSLCRAVGCVVCLWMVVHL